VTSVKKRLEWSARSELDMLAIDQHIAAENPVAAQQVMDYLITQAELLTRFPSTGRIPRPGAPRELVFTRYPYNLIYRVTGAKIRILRVIHQSRQFP